MRKTLIGIALAALLAVPLFAGPTIGIGAGWAEETVFVAPSLGVQYIPDGLGVSSTMHLALAALVTGVDFELAMGGFWEILALTVPVFDLSGGPFGDPCAVEPCPRVGGRMKLIGGIGTPFWLETDGDAVALAGWSLGWLFGAAVENQYGTGLKVLGWYNGDTVGVGLTWYYDLLTPYRDP